MHKIY